MIGEAISTLLTKTRLNHVFGLLKPVLGLSPDKLGYLQDVLTGINCCLVTPVDTQLEAFFPLLMLHGLGPRLKW